MRFEFVDGSHNRRLCVCTLPGFEGGRVIDLQDTPDGWRFVLEKPAGTPQPMPSTVPAFSHDGAMTLPMHS